MSAITASEIVERIRSGDAADEFAAEGEYVSLCFQLAEDVVASSLSPDGRVDGITFTRERESMLAKMTGQARALLRQVGVKPEEFVADVDDALRLLQRLPGRRQFDDELAGTQTVETILAGTAEERAIAEEHRRALGRFNEMTARKKQAIEYRQHLERVVGELKGAQASIGTSRAFNARSLAPLVDSIYARRFPSKAAAESTDQPKGSP